MAKVINPYRGYSASDINSRCSATCTHSVVGSTVECTDITTSKIETVLGISSHSLSTLCTDNAINKYSGFSPYLLSYYNGGGSLDAFLIFTKPPV